MVADCYFVQVTVAWLNNLRDIFVAYIYMDIEIWTESTGILVAKLFIIWLSRVSETMTAIQ